MEHPAFSRHADSGPASAATTRPGRDRPWRQRLPSGDALLAWLAAVAAVTVFIDFAATF